MDFWILQIFYGVSYGALLFLLASGLSLIFGVMRIVNLAHGSYFMLGGYMALTALGIGTGSLGEEKLTWMLQIPLIAMLIAVVAVIVERFVLRKRGINAVLPVMLLVGTALIIFFMLGGSLGLTYLGFGAKSLGMGPMIWVLTIPLAAIVVAAIGLVMERFFLRQMGFDALRQVLLTVGFALLFQQAALDIWGGDNMDIPKPQVLNWSLQWGQMYFPMYRIFMIGLVAVVGTILWFVIEQTRLGAVIRATVDDSQMARGIGIDTSRISMGVFGLGAFLAALGGVIGGGFIGVYPGLDFEVLPLAFAVVIIGGMGSLRGALAGSLIVGLMDNVGKGLFPELAYFTMYAPMVIILAVKPTGLFGRE